MFTKRSKRNYRIAVWTAVVICLCILILYFAWPEKPAESKVPALNPDYDPSVAASSKEEKGLSTIEEYLADDEWDEKEEFTDDETAEDGIAQKDGNLSEKEENSITEPQSPYYLVKRAGNEIAVFFCDSRGNMVQLETTEILYEMLGPDDQLLFDQGIKISSQEELSVLLQDFEG